MDLTEGDRLLKLLEWVNQFGKAPLSDIFPDYDGTTTNTTIGIHQVKVSSKFNISILL
jgi:hypothetical protein